MRPVDVNADNQKMLFIKMYGDPKTWHHDASQQREFNVGDTVRISRIKGHFEKGFDENYTREIFKVSAVLRTEPLQYKLASLKNQAIKGRFYGSELLRVKMKRDALYPVEKILAHRTRDGKRQSLVRYLGWDKSADEWLDDNQLRSIDH
jgi:hypothetical protein